MSGDNSLSSTSAPPPSGVADVALGASAGASIGAVAGALVATGAALSVAVPFIAAGVAGALGAYYGWSHRRNSRAGQTSLAQSDVRQ